MVMVVLIVREGAMAMFFSMRAHAQLLPFCDIPVVQSSIPVQWSSPANSDTPFTYIRKVSSVHETLLQRVKPQGR